MYSPLPIAVRTRRSAACALYTTALIAAFIAALSLSSAAQAVRTGSTPPPDPSRVDIFGGYGYLHPVDSDINHNQYQPINPGAVVSITGYFNRYLGLQAEGSFFPHGPNDCVYTAQAGPLLRYQKGRFVPFAHALAGGAKVGGPVFQPCTWGWGVTSGIGLDYILPVWNNRLAIRPIQADFDYSHVDYGPLVQPADVSGGLGEIFAYRLASGVVLRLGATATPPPVQLGCTIQPVDAFPGDPLTVTATPANLNPKRKTTYTWTTTGGRISGNDTTASVATAGLTPGDFTVSGHVSQGIRPSDQASCSAGFRIHAFEPPTVSCSANPSTVMAGESSTITATAHSPQNRPLSYSYSASSGFISGNAATAILNTTGDAPGPVNITCNVVDDLGQQATAATAVIISAPPVPPSPTSRSLCELTFDRDKKRPVRVDNEAKGCLDDIALTLNRDSTAKLVIVGHHGPDEKPEAAAERTLNAEQYLTVEKGIDPLRIELRTGESTGSSAENLLIPAGAAYDAGSTATFDTGSVKRHGEAYAKPAAKTSKKIRNSAN